MIIKLNWSKNEGHEGDDTIYNDNPTGMAVQYLLTDSSGQNIEFIQINR